MNDPPGSTDGAEASSKSSANMAASGPAMPIDSIVHAPEAATLVTTTSWVAVAPTVVAPKSSDDGFASGSPLGAVQAMRPASSATSSASGTPRRRHRCGAVVFTSACRVPTSRRSHHLNRSVRRTGSNAGNPARSASSRPVTSSCSQAILLGNS